MSSCGPDYYVRSYQGHLCSLNTFIHYHSGLPSHSFYEATWTQVQVLVERVWEGVWDAYRWAADTGGANNALQFFLMSCYREIFMALSQRACACVLSL